MLVVTDWMNSSWFHPQPVEQVTLKAVQLGCLNLPCRTLQQPGGPQGPHGICRRDCHEDPAHGATRISRHSACSPVPSTGQMWSLCSGFCPSSGGRDVLLQGSNFGQVLMCHQSLTGEKRTVLSDSGSAPGKTLKCAALDANFHTGEMLSSQPCYLQVGQPGLHWNSLSWDRLCAEGEAALTTEAKGVVNGIYYRAALTENPWTNSNKRREPALHPGRNLKTTTTTKTKS